MVKELKLAWLAGFIDGEGSIGIHREYDKRKGEDYCVYRPSLSIANTNLASLEEAKRIIGAGSISAHHTSKVKNPKIKLPYHYSLRSQLGIVEILLKLIPYLVIKKTQALLVADFADSRMGTVHRGWYRPYTAEQLSNYGILKALNKRGI